jgi:hypothetical protein
MTQRAHEAPGGMENPMKRWFMTIAAALLLAGTVSPARAIGPVFDWDPAYFWQNPGTFNNLPAGGILRCVGIISQFGPPLDFLNATLPATEYTFYIDGLSSGGTTTVGPPATEIYTTFYTGGTITMFADPTPDAVFAPNPPNALVPSTFVNDPPPILTGVFTSLVVTTNNFTTFKVGSIEGNIQWTGGTLISYFAGPGGETCPGLFTGGATWSTNPGVGIPGYLFRHDGKIDLQCPTPTSKSTWGRLKSLYR